MLGILRRRGTLTVVFFQTPQHRHKKSPAVDVDAVCRLWRNSWNLDRMASQLSLRSRDLRVDRSTGQMGFTPQGRSGTAYIRKLAPNRIAYCIPFL